MSPALVDPAAGLTLEAVIFDMDGLMFDTERVAVESWISAARDHGHEIDRSFFLSSVGLAAKGTRDLLMKIHGPDFPHDAIRQRRLDLAAAYIAEHGVPVKKGLVELLGFLGVSGIPLAVATSTNRLRVDPLLGTSGLAQYFDAVICGDEVVRCKPDPEIYLAAAARLKVAPENCLVLEDSLPGIAAAHAAGAVAVMVPDLIAPDEATKLRARGVFVDLDAVKVWLSGMRLRESIP